MDVILCIVDKVYCNDFLRFIFIDFGEKSMAKSTYFASRTASIELLCIIIGQPVWGCSPVKIQQANEEGATFEDEFLNGHFEKWVS